MENLFNNFFIYTIGIILLLRFLHYVAATQKALGLVLKRPDIKLADPSDCPEYLREFYEKRQPEFIALGFDYIYCKMVDEVYENKSPEKYVFVYYNEETKTYAELKAAGSESVHPFEVTFSTRFKNGNILETSSGARHSILGLIPGVTINDANTISLAEQFKYHREELDQTTEGEIKEYREELSPGDIIAQDLRIFDKYLEHLEEKGTI
ncbi:MAG: hypothetical protein GY757_34665, partial [bacterium]|nr:hypothetical protein [bacterium]